MILTRIVALLIFQLFVLFLKNNYTIQRVHFLNKLYF